MKPADETGVLGDENRGVWRRLRFWVRANRPLVWLVGLTAGLVLFLAWLPPYIRTLFLHELQSQALLASMILGFSLLVLSLLWAAGQRLDAWTFQLINLRGRRPAWLDMLMQGITQIGNGMAGVALAVILFFTGYHLLAYEVILGTLTLWLVVELVKALVHRRRPFIRLSEARIVGQPPGGRSFPSGHTSQAFFMATLLAASFDVSFGEVCLLYAIALLVGITRMYVGAHYPRDVLAGAILGSAWGLLGGIVFGYAL